jgi:hypothetical protein
VLSMAAGRTTFGEIMYVNCNRLSFFLEQLCINSKTFAGCLIPGARLPDNLDFTVLNLTLSLLKICGHSRIYYSVETGILDLT